MGGLKHGGYSFGPESGYPVTHHGTEYTLNADQIKAIQDLAGGTGRGVTVNVQVAGEDFQAILARAVDTYYVRAQRRGTGTRERYF